MLCRFDWKVLKRCCESNEEILKFFRFVLTQDISYASIGVKRYFKTEMKHPISFLLNAEGLLTSDVTLGEKIVYIDLAARRDYVNYYTQGVKHLDLRLYQDLNRDKLLLNNLIEIENDNLYFKYE